MCKNEKILSSETVESLSVTRIINFHVFQKMSLLMGCHKDGTNLSHEGMNKCGSEQTDDNGTTYLFALFS